MIDPAEDTTPTGLTDDAPAELGDQREARAQVAALAMYPFSELFGAYDALWADVHRGLGWGPPLLDRRIDLHESWAEPNLVVAQTCGWPLVTRLAGKVHVLGAFRLTHPQAVGSSYRSVIMATDRRPIEEFAGAPAAVNSSDSLSGWVSLVAAVHRPGAWWEGPVVWTGAHTASLRALRSGEAVVASIDSLTLAHVRRWQPELVDGLFEVGLGPLVSSLPLITSLRTQPAQLAELRVAIADAAGRCDPCLFIDGFDALELDDYLPLLDLGPLLTPRDQSD